MKYIIIIFNITFLFSMTGLDLATKMENRDKPTDTKSKSTMELLKKNGKKRTLKLINKSKDNSKKQMIWFLEPRDDYGIAFLKIEKKGEADFMNMWLPGFKKFRRISSQKKTDSFMGSDMSYEDLSNRELNENEYKRLDDEIVNGVECYVLEIIPKKEVKSSYSKHISWIAKNGLYGVKEESFDKRGILLKKKEYTFNKVQEYYIIERVFVENVQKQHSTEVTFLNVKVDSGIDDGLFHEKNLKRLPRN